MALAPILDMGNEILVYLGVDSSYAQKLQLIQKYVENQARKFVGHGITQETYTNEYHRRHFIGYSEYDSDLISISGDQVYVGGGEQCGGEIIQLDNGYVRSVTDLREDYSANFGSGESDFAESTQLTEGTDFYLELDSDGMSKTGNVIRRNRYWSVRPGTIRVTYTAGFTSAELDDEYSFVKMALLDEIQIRFNASRAQQDSIGPVKKESYAGDYSVEYAINDTTMESLAMGLLPQTLQRLSPIKRIRL